jgi:hypothetical protein
MKLQAKSFLSSLGQPRVSRGAARPGSGSNLQALAAEIHQSATQGVFEYPRNWVLIAKVAAVMLMSLTLVSMLSLLRPVLQVIAAQQPFYRAGVSVWEIAGTAIAGAMAFVLAGMLLTLFPTIKVSPQGLGVSELVGWRRISWNQIGTLRVMEMGNERYVVMIPFKGITRPPTPAPIMRLIPLLVGASGKRQRGIIVTSNMTDFDRMIQMMVSYMSQAAGHSVPRVELFVDETATMPLAQLVLEPDSAIMRLARPEPVVDAYGMPLDFVESAIDWPKVLLRQAVLAAPPGILFVISALLGGSAPSPSILTWAAVVVACGVVELPFAGKLAQIVGDMMVGNGQFGRAVWAHLELQMPRAIFVMAGIALIGLGLPVAIAQICWLAGIGVTTYLFTRYIQRIYYISATQTLMAALGVLIYQVAMLALFMGLS